MIQPSNYVPAPKAREAGHHQARRRGWRYTWFSFQGRLSRSEYWVSGMLLRYLALLLLALVLALPLALVGYLLGAQALETFGNLVAVVFGIGYAWSELAVTVKRLHDRGQSGWWTLGLLVPVLNLWLFICVAFLAGTRGPNRYGPSRLMLSEPKSLTAILA